MDKLHIVAKLRKEESKLKEEIRLKTQKLLKDHKAYDAAEVVRQKNIIAMYQKKLEVVSKKIREIALGGKGAKPTAKRG